MMETANVRLKSFRDIESCNLVKATVDLFHTWPTHDDFDSVTQSFVSLALINVIYFNVLFLGKNCPKIVRTFYNKDQLK
jgi:hypothetical protein